jgi:hypothetical protein
MDDLRGKWGRGLRQAVSACLIALAGCGGGGDSTQAGVSSGGTGSFSIGDVTAKGSIVVTGVHFDQTTAKKVVDADNVAMRWEDIDLGMMVEVEAGDVSTTATGRQEAASTVIRVTNALLGPVTSIDGDTLNVMGQPVRITPHTFVRARVGSEWVNAERGEIAVGHVVEVHGFQDVDAKEFIATRVERKAPGTVVSVYVVRGVIKGLTAEGCRIGSQQIKYVWPATAWLRDGKVARARLYAATYEGPDTNWRAVDMRISEPLVAEHGNVRQDGVITERLSDILFGVDGVTVQTETPCPICQPGDRVSVRGVMEKSVLKTLALDRQP